jgi:O-antigen ligase
VVINYHATVLRRSGLLAPVAPAARPRIRRDRASVGLVVAGALGSLLLLALAATPGVVLVPLSIGLLGALAICPFPAADRALVLGILGTLPLLPPSGLPNLPLGAAVIPLAIYRVARDGGLQLDRRVIGVLAALWAALALGAALSHWPAVSMWARPVAILSLAALASVLGALVWRDPDRRRRWLEGLSIALLAVALTALVVFALQYLLSIPSAVRGLTTVLGYLRGDGAAAKFEDQNNWVIWGRILTLRAFSPIFPAPTNTGGFIGIAAPLVAAAWVVQSPGPWRRLAALSLASAAAVVLVSFSRSTWVAAAVAVIAAAALVILWARIRQLVVGAYRGRFATLGLLAAVGIAIGLAGVLSVGTPASGDRITDAFGDPSVTTRIEIDRGAVAAFNADMLRGAGLGNWEASLPTHTGKAYVHNVYLEYAAATGVFGLLWAVLLIAILLGAGTILIRRAADPPTTILGLGVVVVALFTGVQFVVDDNLLNPQYTWLLLWVIGGSLAAASRVLRSETAPSGL